MSSNSNSKSLAAMFLVGAFLFGGVVGFMADRAVAVFRPRGRPFTEDAMRDELSIKLKLTAAQRVALDSVYDWRSARTEEIMQPIRPQIQAVRDSAASGLMPHLDSIQAAMYQAIRDTNAARNRLRNMPDSARRAQGERR